MAQHSILTSYLVEPQFAAAALLHDISEAVIGDISTPLGRYIDELSTDILREWVRPTMVSDGALAGVSSTPLAAFKHRLEAFFVEDFGVESPRTPEVKAADTLALHIERRLFMATPVADPGDWPAAMVNIDTVISGLCSAHPELRYTMAEHVAFAGFMARAAELGVSHGKTVKTADSVA